MSTHLPADQTLLPPPLMSQSQQQQSQPSSSWASSSTDPTPLSLETAGSQTPDVVALFEHRLRAILATADLEVTSVRKLRRLMEDESGLSLSAVKLAFESLVLSILNDVVSARDAEQAAAATDSDHDHDALHAHHNADAAETSSHDTHNRSKKSSSAHSQKARSRSIDQEKEKKKSPGRTITFLRPWKISPELSELLGVDEISRPQAIKGIWAHIHKHNLQDPKDKRYIQCDAKLKKIFKLNRVHMFTMIKLLSEHFECMSDVPDDIADLKGSPPVAVASSASDSKKDRKRIKLTRKSSPGRMEKIREKKIGIFAEMNADATLAEFLGQDKISRPELTKRVWAYVRQHDLQDKTDKRYVICDAALKKIFKMDRVHMYTMQKLFSVHLTRSDGNVDDDVGDRENVRVGDGDDQDNVDHGDSTEYA